MKYQTILGSAAACMTLFAAGVAQAAPVQVKVTIENLGPTGGIAFSPFFVAAHDGTFDTFDTGSAASMGIQNIAEFGDGTDLASDFASSHPSGVSGTVVATSGGFGPGIFPSGASGSLVLNLDSNMHRYFSFGSMAVPSNDFFVGNESGTGIELFDAGGGFVASTVTLTGANIWDSGTEVNGLFGAAYVVGQSAGDHIDENSVVTLGADFSTFLGQSTPTGATFSDLPGSGDQIARISFSIVPEPASAMLMISALGVGLVRRRTQNNV